MDGALKRRILVGGVAALAVAGGGAAVAASKLSSPKEESQAVVNDAAGQLGIAPSKLSAALKKALENRIDAAVADGRLTKEQGEALKARIRSDDFPLFGFPGPHHGPHGFADLDAAASYLGLSEAELRSQLAAGKSLAQIAKDRGKSVDGLVQALVDDLKTKLDAAVAAGRLTKAQADAILSDAKTRISERVNRSGPEFGFRRGGFGFHPGFEFRSGSPPDLDPPTA